MTKLELEMERWTERIEEDWDLDAEEFSLQVNRDRSCFCDLCEGHAGPDRALLEWAESVRPWIKLGPGHPLVDFYDGIADMEEM